MKLDYARKKTTNSELATRVEATIELIAKGYPTAIIKRELRAKFGSLSARTCASYISRAREELLKGCGLTREQLRAESFAFYQNVICDPGSTTAVRIKARERIDRLFGLEAPIQAHLSAAFSGPTAYLDLPEKEEIVDAEEGDEDEEAALSKTELVTIESGAASVPERKE